MLTFRVMDKTGDTPTTFDMADAQAVGDAMERFKELTITKRHLAHIPAGDGTPGEQLQPSDPDIAAKLKDATEVIFQPQLVGG